MARPDGYAAACAHSAGYFRGMRCRCPKIHRNVSELEVNSYVLECPRLNSPSAICLRVIVVALCSQCGLPVVCRLSRQRDFPAPSGWSGGACGGREWRVAFQRHSPLATTPTGRSMSCCPASGTDRPVLDRQDRTGMDSSDSMLAFCDVEDDGLGRSGDARNRLPVLASPMSSSRRPRRTY